MSIHVSAVVSEGLTEQAEVTNWPLRLLLVAGMVALILLVLWAMRSGWKRRQRRQQDIPPPPSLLGIGEEGAQVGGLYVGTATAGDWLDRIAVHGLGVRSRGVLAWSAQGVDVQRSGASSFSIPGSDIVGIRVDSGVAGTVRSKGSVVVITWRLGERTLDTGFRADDEAGHRLVLDGLMVTFPAGVDS